MASSAASLHLWLSTRVLLLFLLLRFFRPSSSAVIPAGRWNHPCDGNRAIANDIAEEEIATTTTDDFAGLSNRSVGLKRYVKSLKNDYVNARLGDAISAEAHKEQSGLVIPGSPSWNTSTDDMRETLLTCYENLARLAVLTQWTREGELTEPGNPNFATRLTGIENDSEAGLYAIMCHLRAVLASMGIETISPEVASVSLPAVLDHGHRHVRDYVVLRILEDSADTLSSRFARLVGRTISQTTPSTTQ